MKRENECVRYTKTKFIPDELTDLNKSNIKPIFYLCYALASIPFWVYVLLSVIIIAIIWGEISPGCI